MSLKKPLEGIKVVELGTFIAVPTATRWLADWGAEVIKIEGLQGDDWRHIGPGFRTPKLMMKTHFLPFKTQTKNSWL